jgi:hypothetical protein
MASAGEVADYVKQVHAREQQVEGNVCDRRLAPELAQAKYEEHPPPGYQVGYEGPGDSKQQTDAKPEGGLEHERAQPGSHGEEGEVHRRRRHPRSGQLNFRANPAA